MVRQVQTWLAYIASNRRGRRYFGVCLEAGWTERKRDGWPWVGPAPTIRVLRRDLRELEAYKLELAGLLQAFQEDEGVELARGACCATAQLGVTMAAEVRRLLERLEDGTADLARPNGAYLPPRVRCHLLGRCFKCRHRWFRGHRCPAVPAELPPLDAPVEPKPRPKSKPKPAELQPLAAPKPRPKPTPRPKLMPKPARKAVKKRPGPKPKNAGAPKVQKPQKRLRSPQQVKKRRKARRAARKAEAKREKSLLKAERARCSEAMRDLRAAKKTAKKSTK